MLAVKNDPNQSLRSFVLQFAFIFHLLATFRDRNWLIYLPLLGSPQSPLSHCFCKKRPPASYNQNLSSQKQNLESSFWKTLVQQKKNLFLQSKLIQEKAAKKSPLQTPISAEKIPFCIISSHEFQGPNIELGDYKMPREGLDEALLHCSSASPCCLLHLVLLRTRQPASKRKSEDEKALVDFLLGF